MRGVSTSDKTRECLSDREHETFVNEIYSEIQQTFGHRVELSQQHAKDLLKRVYRIVRHAGQRLSLKNRFRQQFHGDESRFKGAWESLLYMTRIYYAAVAFVDLATNAAIESIYFGQIPKVYASKLTNSDERSPTQVLASFGHSDLAQPWKAIFQDAEKMEQFIRISRLKKKVVHAEVQLICHVKGLENTCEAPTSDVFPYIGCSRKCCFLCELFRQVYGTFDARGTHHTLFPIWAFPARLPLQSLPLLHRFSQNLQDILRAILALPSCPTQGTLLRQSSAALSTSKAELETPVYSSRPEVLR